MLQINLEITISLPHSSTKGFLAAKMMNFLSHYTVCPVYTMTTTGYNDDGDDNTTHYWIQIDLLRFLTCNLLVGTSIL